MKLSKIIKNILTENKRGTIILKVYEKGGLLLPGIILDIDKGSTVGTNLDYEVIILDIYEGDYEIEVHADMLGAWDERD